MTWHMQFFGVLEMAKMQIEMSNTVHKMRPFLCVCAMCPGPVALHNLLLC